MAQDLAARSLLYVVLGFMRIVKSDFAAGADGVSVSASQYRILRRLQDGEATVSELAAWNGVTLPTATKILDVLVEREWVERWRSRADRRLVHVGLTPRGRQVQAQLEDRATASVALVLEQLDTPTQGMVSDMVASLAEALVAAEAAREAGLAEVSTDDES